MIPSGSANPTAITVIIIIAAAVVVVAVVISEVRRSANPSLVTPGVAAGEDHISLLPPPLDQSPPAQETTDLPVNPMRSPRGNLTPIFTHIRKYQQTTIAFMFFLRK